MAWFFFALICALGWGFADLFYKKGTEENDKQSHLKIAVWVGLVMGLCALVLLLLLRPEMTPVEFFTNILKYLPASLSYIISMVVGYAGLRYLELSIISPIQNASGALSAICMIVYFAFIGKIKNFFEEFSVLDIIGSIFIIAGVIALAFVENHLSKEEVKVENNDRKYRYGALAIIFPLLYCVFDTIGTAADGIILDENSGMNLSEIDVLILYGLTFFAAGLVCWLYMLIKNKKPYNPFHKSEINKGIAACCEEAGQVFYIYAMALNPVLAAPMVASYCILSVVLSRIFIKEKLRRSQYLCVVLVILGIIILGISEGLAS
ncbi:MAG: EamA family transporter [Lachnospiraceae bacterium]|nr:EamA family transporter [Lachnospiraceae bacterium]